MGTKPTPEMYLSNLLFWQCYHGCVTFRSSTFILPCPKLIWYRNIQLYTYLPVSVDLSSGSLLRFLKYLLTSYLLILLGGFGLILVFVFLQVHNFHWLQCRFSGRAFFYMDSLVQPYPSPFPILAIDTDIAF